MRMMQVTAAVVALGLSLMVLGGLGVSDHFGSGGEVGLEEEIEEQSGAAAAEEEATLDPEEGDDTGFLSFVVGAVGQMRDLATLALFLPSTLESLGAPFTVARAIGHGTQLVILVGLVQIAIQFNIR